MNASVTLKIVAFLQDDHQQHTQGSDIFIVQVASCLILEAAEPVLWWLGDQKTGEEAEAEVDAGEDEQEAGNSGQKIGVSEVTLVYPGGGGADVVRVDDYLFVKWSAALMALSVNLFTMKIEAQDKGDL